METESIYNNVPRPSSPVKTSLTTVGPGASKNAQALTILNTLHPDSFIPYRHMGWNMFDTIRTHRPFIYRINQGISNNIVLKKVCEERGWQEYQDVLKYTMRKIERDLYSNSKWNLWWSYNFYNGSPYRTLKCWQYTNHNPRAFQFCSKSYLSRFLRRMHEEFGNIYDFGPKTFLMPEDYVRFVTEHSKRQDGESSYAKNVIGTESMLLPSDSKSLFISEDKKPKFKEIRHLAWIIKPVGRSQGRGIVLTKEVSKVVNCHRCVVQEYIARPLLIGEYKFDLRIYVLVASTDPLVVYMYREGLCRFATEKFDLTNLDASLSHLTNASLNKLGPDYATNKEVIGSGCKWSLKQLRSHFRKEKCRDWLLWQKIMSIVLLTVVGEGLKSGFTFPANRNCFDFFGFDILVDEDMEPWLLEVNYSPGLGGDCQVDEIVKKPMLHELFDLLGFPNSDGKVEKEKTPSLNLSSSPTASELKEKIQQIPRRPKLTLDCGSMNVDVTCKARLKEASQIYSQNLVLEYFGNNFRNPNFHLTPQMKVMYERKISHAKRKQRYEDKMEKLRKKEKASSRPSTVSGSSEEDSTEEKPIEDSRPSTADSQDSRKTFVYIQRQDWNEAPLKAGNWCLVYPCSAFPYKSPYKSPLADLRNTVKTIENYQKIAKSIVKSFPEESDEFYESRVKAMCRWNIEIWSPPTTPVDDEEDIVPILQ